jgi:exodeoxyribonuclease VII large subunit
LSDNRQIVTLKQIVSSVKKTIETRYAQPYWVKAEMHKLNLYPSGHAFPELVQKEDGKIIATINGSIWKANFQRINKHFIDTVKEPLKEGTTLLLQVKITYNELYGISLQIIDIDPSYSLGELQRERQESLLRLKKEGILSNNQCLPFPMLPQRVAIISADTSKGLADFMKILNNNPWEYTFFTMLFHAYLQGDSASASIRTQLRRIEKVKHHFDLVVIVRGGGGEVGLSCYNEFELCKAIATFPIPVLTGIGHSTNLTVAEMIAFRNAITPSELGEFLIQAFHDVNVPVKKAAEQLKRISDISLERWRSEFNHSTNYFRQNARASMSKQRVSLEQLTQKLSSLSMLNCTRETQKIGFLKQQLKTNNKRLFFDKNEFLRDAREFLKQNSEQYIEETKLGIQRLQKSVELLHPKNVLKRGYSISRLNGKTISGKNQAKLNDLMEIETYETKIEVEVKRVEKSK